LLGYLESLKVNLVLAASSLDLEPVDFLEGVLLNQDVEVLAHLEEIADQDLIPDLFYVFESKFGRTHHMLLAVEVEDLAEPSLLVDSDVHRLLLDGWLLCLLRKVLVWVFLELQIGLAVALAATANLMLREFELPVLLHLARRGLLKVHILDH